MKKILMSMTMVLLAFIMVVAPVSAAAGWQNLGTDVENFYGFKYDDNYTSGKVFISADHGNIGVNVLSQTQVTKGNGYTPVMQVQVYEDDGAVGDDWIGTFYYYPNSAGTQLFTFDIDAFRDGANGKAEIQLRYTSNFQGTVFANILD